MKELPPAIINEKTQLVPLKKLRPFPGNARLGNVEKLVEMIRENGFIGHIIVNKRKGQYENTILIGNHRYEAATKVGLKEIPVTWVDVDDERARKINISDNRASDLATYDEAQRLMQLREVVKYGDMDDLPGIGYDEDELERIRRIVEEPQELPKARSAATPKTRILVQCTCPRCDESWTGFIDEDANVQRVDRRSRRSRPPKED